MISNVEGISPVSTASLPRIPEFKDSSTNPLAHQTTSHLESNIPKSMEIGSSTNTDNESQSTCPIKEIKPVSIVPIPDEKLAAITESTLKIKLAAQLTAEQAVDLLQRNGATIQRTAEASRRLDALVNRAETYRRSFDNPGCTVMYTAFGSTALYSIYNVVRYGLLPLMGVFRGMLADARAGTGAKQSSNTTSHVSNINYPEKVINVPISPRSVN